MIMIRTSGCEMRFKGPVSKAPISLIDEETNEPTDIFALTLKVKLKFA